MPWTTEQKIFIVEAYFRQKSIHTAQSQFRERFGCREFPVHSMIYRRVNKFRTHGTVHNLNHKVSLYKVSRRCKTIVVIKRQQQTTTSKKIPSFSQRIAPIACSFCEVCTWHDLHILVTAPFCCDRKARAACAQSFTLWQQATIEITRRDHSIIACSRHMYMVLFFAHIPFVVNRTFSATPAKRLQQHPLVFTTKRTVRTFFFLWRLHLARPSHPGHSTILMRSESPSGMCARLHTVAASNNRDHAPQSLCYCLFASPIYRCYQFFFKENVRSPVWICMDFISLILGTRVFMILGTRW